MDDVWARKHGCVIEGHHKVVDRVNDYIMERFSPHFSRLAPTAPVPITDVDEALKPDAPKIHAKGNLLSRSAIVRGNPDEAFANSAHVVEDTDPLPDVHIEPASAQRPSVR